MIFRRATFTLWKDGGVVQATLKGAAHFTKSPVYEPLRKNRVFAVDTESLSCITPRGDTYRRRCAACGAYAGEKPPNEPCAGSPSGYVDCAFAYVDAKGAPLPERTLRTLLVPVHFEGRTVVLETPSGKGMLDALFAEVFSQPGYAEVERAPSSRRQRKRPEPSSGERKRSRPGRRVTTEPVLSVWFNLPYDLGRLFSDSKRALKGLASGADSYRIAISPRFEVEVARISFGSSSSFEWYVRTVGEHPDPETGEPTRKVHVVRMLGMDLTGYWKSSLAAAAKAAGVQAKDDIEAKIEGVYEKPREEFTPEEWEMFRAYAAGDTVTTLELYHRTVELLVGIDARVVRKTGVIPPSAPGAAARIVFAKAFDCHPGMESWERYPDWADQIGLDAYFGGRAFCTRPGVHARMATLDLKSAYPFQMALLPDPVTVEMVQAEPETYEGPRGQEIFVTQWRGRYGVLYASGESFDDVMPAFRVHDENRSGRLRYVAGRFHDVAVTIPELVIGVLRGAIRVDAIVASERRRSAGVVMVGSAETSFLRAGMKDLFALKEDKTKEPALRNLAKLLANATYGKLIEVRKTEFLVAEKYLMRPFKARQLVCEGIARVFAGDGDLDSHDLFWGETPLVEEKAERWFRAALAEVPRTPHGTRDPAQSVVAYVEALDVAGAHIEVDPATGKEKPACFVGDYVRKWKSYSCGHYFMPLYASQVTGATSAMVGLMAHVTGALQGDTDSVHCVLPEGTDRIADLAGIARYFAIMKEAGYPSPYVVDGKTVGGIEGLGKLGIWEEECETPSVDSVLVRPKLYSHKFLDAKKVSPENPSGEVFKQAKHGFAKFHTPDVERALKDMRVSRESRTKEAAFLRQRGLHDAMRELLTTGVYTYETRQSPRKLKEAIANGTEVGEFTSREMKMVSRSDPNTELREDGVVHWKPSLWDSDLRGPNALPPGEGTAPPRATWGSSRRAFGGTQMREVRRSPKRSGYGSTGSERGVSGRARRGRGVGEARVLRPPPAR